METKRCPVVAPFRGQILLSRDCDPEASLAPVPALIMEPAALKLTDAAPRRARPAGVYLTQGFTSLEAETQKTFSSLQIFIKYLSTFNLSHHAIYNGISGDVLCSCRFNFLPNPYMPPWLRSRALLPAGLHHNKTQTHDAAKKRDLTECLQPITAGIKSYLTLKSCC